MTSRDRSHVVDVLEAARLVIRFAEPLGGAEALGRDLLRQSAVLRQLEIMGEATKRLSAGLREDHPSMPWRKIAGDFGEGVGAHAPAFAAFSSL